MDITKDTVLGKILVINGVKEILEKFKFPCLDCPFVRMEMDKLKIGEVCEKYGINTNKLLEELNKNIKVKK